MSATHWLEEGKKEYTSKRYADTVRLASKAISTNKVSLETHLQALDLRCQAYVKLGKNDSALQDARRMIRLGKKESSTGYIRCSQIERQSGNYAAAIRWLEHGSKNVPRQQSLFADQLRRVKELSREQGVLQKRRDPVTSVPLEILQNLLSHLDYKEVFCLLRVSRAWRNVLSNVQPLTNQIDFSRSRKTVTYQSCTAALKMLRKPVRSVVLGPMSQTAINAVQSWLLKFTNLESLEVLDFKDAAVRFNMIRHNKLGAIKSLRVNQEQNLTLKKVFEIIAGCQSLQEVILHGIRSEPVNHVPKLMQTRLRHLELSTDKHTSGLIFPPSLFENHPNLDILSICGGRICPTILNLSNLHNLRKVRLYLRQTGMDLHLPRSLEDLDCDGFFGTTSATVFSFTEPLELPNLRKVMFREGPNRDGWDLRFIRLLQSSVSPPQLHEVEFQLVDFDMFRQELGHERSIFRSCQILALSSHNLKDNDSVTFSTCFPSVELLTLEAPMITGVFISDIVKSPKQSIKQIVLKDCSRVSSDIIAWLKARSIECRISQSSDRSAGGRRVRDG